MNERGLERVEGTVRESQGTGEGAWGKGKAWLMYSGQSGQKAVGLWVLRCRASASASTSAQQAQRSRRVHLKLLGFRQPPAVRFTGLASLARPPRPAVCFTCRSGRRAWTALATGRRVAAGTDVDALYTVHTILFLPFPLSFSGATMYNT